MGSKYDMTENKNDPESEEQRQNTDIVFEERDAEIESLEIVQSRTKNNETLGYSKYDDNNHDLESKLNGDNSAFYLVKGPCPQGEDNTLPVCKILVQALNEAGENWDEPKDCSRSNDDVDCLNQKYVDCRALDKNNDNESLCIQVVRAIVDKNFWENLSRRGHIHQKEPINKLTKKLKLAIEKKFYIPDSRRPSLVLALDATLLPVFIIDDVLRAYVSQYGSWTRSLGFQSVWIVGPKSVYTKRIDIISSPYQK